MSQTRFNFFFFFLGGDFLTSPSSHFSGYFKQRRKTNVPVDVICKPEVTVPAYFPTQDLG